jgi:hypothetical protein
MRDERLEVSVTFVPAKGYVASAPELRQPVVAVSLGGLRRRIEALMLPDSVDVRLMLDRAARHEPSLVQLLTACSEGKQIRASDDRG